MHSNDVRQLMAQQDQKRINEIVIQLAQLWVIAKCQCVPTKMYHSESHLDCFAIDPWLIDEFRNCANSFSKKIREADEDQQASIPRVRLNSIDTLHIEVDSLCSTTRQSNKKM